MSIRLVTRFVLTLAFALAAAPELWAQVGLQITIGSYGRGYGGIYGTPFGVGPVGPGPFGVGPSLPFGPGGRAIFPAPYYSGYRGYYDYRGYDYYLPSSAVGIYSSSPYAIPQPISPPDYPYSGTGPYSGTYGNSMNRTLNYYDNYFGNDYYQSQSAIRPQSSYASGSRIVSPDTPDLRPGMVLPDGSTVLSVDEPRAVGKPELSDGEPDLSGGKPGDKSGTNTPPIASGADKLPVPPPVKPLPAKSGRTAF